MNDQRFEQGTVRIGKDGFEDKWDATDIVWYVTQRVIRFRTMNDDGERISMIIQAAEQERISVTQSLPSGDV